MKNPIYPYPGRQIFLGLTIEGNPCLVYLITGRSPASRERKAVQMGNKVIIGPLGDVSYDPLRHYTALQYDDAAGIAAITNGIQTEAIFETYRLLYNVGSEPSPDYLQMLMEGARHEPDSLNTPRIGGIITRTDNGNGPVNILSIKRHDMKAAAVKLALKNGTITGISTYDGALENPAPFDFSKGLPELTLAATRASEVAGFLFDVSAAASNGLDIRVCTVAAVLTTHGWDVAVQNAQ